MAFATDAQRRWFFAHLATGMRRIAGKMRESFPQLISHREQIAQIKENIIAAAESDLSASAPRKVRLLKTSDEQGIRYRIAYDRGKGKKPTLTQTFMTHEQMM